MIQTSRNTTTATTFLVTITKRFNRRRPQHPWLSSSAVLLSSSWFPLLSSTSSFQLQHRQQQYCNYTTTTCKYFSSSTRYKNQNKKQKKTSSSSSSFELQALPFTISPEAALAKFRNWSEHEQGLQYLMQYDSIRIGAAYVPCWSFGLNLRFRQQQHSAQTQTSTRYSWKPPIFDIYDTVATKRTRTTKNDVIYLQGVSSYAGYTYRRSVIDPVHATTLFFLEWEDAENTTTEPFGSWMLQDMVLQESGEPVRVIPDVWTATQRQAFASLKEQYQQLTNTAWHADQHNNNNNNNLPPPPPTVQTQVVSARRVFMPTFVIEYTILGLEYQAFVSGCDTLAPVGGVSHRLFETTRTTANLGLFSASTNTRTTKEFHRSSQTILRRLFVSSKGGDIHDKGGGAAATIVATAKTLVRNIPLPILLGFVRPVWNTLFFVLLRVVSMIPIVGVAGGVFAGFRKIILPYLDNKFANADWERQRQHEYEERRREQGNNHQQYYQDEDKDDKSQQKQNYSMNDFDDVSGRARQHFNRNKDRILRSLSGDDTTATDSKDRAGDFDWYTDWQSTSLYRTIDFDFFSFINSR